MENNNIINWLEEWCRSQCNGDWEHGDGIKIETLDNPGWSVTIDLSNMTTKLEEIPYQLFEKSKRDWYGYSIKDMKYKAAGDPTKLKFLLELFQKLVKSAA